MKAATPNIGMLLLAVDSSFASSSDVLSSSGTETASDAPPTLSSLESSFGSAEALFFDSAYQMSARVISPRTPPPRVPEATAVELLLAAAVELEIEPESEDAVFSAISSLFVAF